MGLSAVFLLLLLAIAGLWIYIQWQANRAWRTDTVTTRLPPDRAEDLVDTTLSGMWWRPTVGPGQINRRRRAPREEMRITFSVNVAPVEGGQGSTVSMWMGEAIETIRRRGIFRFRSVDGAAIAIRTKRKLTRRLLRAEAALAPATVERQTDANSTAVPAPDTASGPSWQEAALPPAASPPTYIEHTQRPQPIPELVIEPLVPEPIEMVPPAATTPPRARPHSRTTTANTS